MVIKKIKNRRTDFICEICRTDYGGREEAEDLERAEKCEESCKRIHGEQRIEIIRGNKKGH